MTKLRIRIDRSKCVGAGVCVFNAPEIFDQDEDDGMVVLLQPEPPDELSGKASKAAMMCPARVIEVDFGSD